MVQIKLIDNSESGKSWETVAHQTESERNVESGSLPQYYCTDHHHLVMTNLEMTIMDIRCITKTTTTTTMEGLSEEKYISHQLNSLQVVGKLFL